MPQGATKEQLTCNLRIATGSSGDRIACRILQVRSAHKAADLLSAVCSKLRSPHRLATTPLSAEEGLLVVLGEAPIKDTEVVGDGWRARVTDKGQRDLSFSEFRDSAALADLLERTCVIIFEQMPRYWRLSSSTRYWYDGQPENVADSVEMIRRISFSTLVVPNYGIGVVFDFGYLFQTEHTLDFYFDHELSVSEQKKRREEFDRLRGRPDRRKGTLLYDIGSQMRNQCYFSEADPEATCANVGPFEFGGRRYNSLYDYYRLQRPNLNIQPDDAVVHVSFRGLKGDKPVAAKLLRLRVNLDPEKIPFKFRRQIASPPYLRDRWSTKLWEQISKKIVAQSEFHISPQLWTPSAEQQELLPCPTLVFGQQLHIRGPKRFAREDYQSYYRARRETLQKGGVYDFDETASRDLILVTPPDSSRWSSKLQNTFVQDLVAQIDGLAKKRFRVKVVRAERCDEIVQALKDEKKSFAAIVFDDRERAAYSVLSHELSAWRIKRFTRYRIERAWCAREWAHSEFAVHKAERDWNDIMFHSAIDVLDQMGATPWRLATWPYEACLVIDVSEDRRYFGLSLLICRNEAHWPSFYRMTRTWPKGDHQHETIQPSLLADKIDQLVADLQKVAEGIDILDSLLVLRDGRDYYGDELEGVYDALERWQSRGFLRQEALVDTASILKHSVKHLRMWQRCGDRVNNVLEGQAIYIGDTTAVISCTGAGTLGGRGTAEPIILEAQNDSDIRRIARGVFALTQLNYSSPTKAHREPQPIRELDAALSDRVDHDMRGIK